MKIAIVDGQGSGIGKAIVEKLGKVKNLDFEIIALGTNSAATAAMLKAGAGSGATGENAIRIMCHKVDIIIGSLAIIMADSMMGEITEGMAVAISSSSATKVLLPLNRCNTIVAGTLKTNLNDLLDSAIEETIKLINSEKA